MLQFIFSSIESYRLGANVAPIAYTYYLMCLVALVPTAILFYNLIRSKTSERMQEFYVLITAGIAGFIIFLWPNILWAAKEEKSTPYFLLAASLLILNVLLGYLAPQARWRSVLATLSAYPPIFLLTIFPEIFLGGSLREGLGAIFWPIGFFIGFIGWAIPPGLEPVA